MKHRIEEHYNLAGEYNRGRTESAPDNTLAPTTLTLDGYVNLVRAFGKCALTFDRTPKREYDELDEIVLRLGPHV